MASIGDLQGIYGPETPAGFGLADIALQRAGSTAQYDLARNRIMRDFSQFDLPDLLASQASRGALASGATRRKVNRQATGVNDQLSGLALGYGGDQARHATNALLGVTGIRLGDLV